MKTCKTTYNNCLFRNMKVEHVIYGVKINILEVLLIGALKWVSSKYVHFELEIVPIC